MMFLKVRRFPRLHTEKPHGSQLDLNQPGTGNRPWFWYDPRVKRVRLALLLFLASFSHAQTLEDAVKILAQRVLAKLALNDSAHVTMRNLTTVSAADAAQAQQAFERLLQRKARNPMPVEVVLSLSSNPRGYLLIAEVSPPNEPKLVELTTFQPPQLPTTGAVVLEKKLEWKQPVPILDLVVTGDQMIVLSPGNLFRYERLNGEWQRVESAALPSPPLRDPRGRLDVSAEIIQAAMPDSVCKTPRSGVLEFKCDPGGGFSAASNTLQAENGPPYFAEASAGPIHLIAELDGRIHVYDPSRKPLGAFDGWGSDFVALESPCGTRFAATSASSRTQNDSIAAYDIVNNLPVRVSDQQEFPGPVTALWSSQKMALAVVKNLATGLYEAYTLSMACNR